MSLMSASSALRNVALPLALAFTVAAGSASAGGLNAGTCYKRPVVGKVIDSESQTMLMAGNRDSSEVENRNANAFFMNDDGSGYVIEGGAPLGVKPSPDSKSCVRYAFNHGQAYNPNDPMPAWARDIKAVNGADIQKAYAHGSRIIFGAQTYSAGVNGEEVPGKYLVVLKTGSEASVWTVDLQGVPYNGFFMTNVQILPKMAELMNKAPAVSSVAGNTVAMASPVIK